jgi:hypothetical protein
MPAKANPRNHRNNPYLLDGLAMRMNRSAAGVLWRFRTEVILLTLVGAGYTALSRLVSLALAAVIVGGLALILAVLAQSRRFIIRRFWCVLSRHRIQKVCYETRMHTRSGRLPLVLRIHPTRVGERALVWCRAGICAADFEAHAQEIAAACYARQARVEGNRRWAQLVQVDIVRRDTLASHHVISSGLARLSPKWRQAS